MCEIEEKMDSTLISVQYIKVYGQLPLSLAFFVLFRQKNLFLFLYNFGSPNLSTQEFKNATTPITFNQSGPSFDLFVLIG